MADCDPYASSFGWLSPGTVGHGVFGNPKSGNQGALSVDGTLVGWIYIPAAWTVYASVRTGLQLNAAL